MIDKIGLQPLFEPRSITLIGASTKELSIGNVIIKNLQKYGFNGPIYPVNPTTDEVLGLKSYKSVLDIPDEIDLAHIVIPPSFVPQEVENCGIKGVKAIIINTAGFKEMGAHGLALENDFLNRAKKYGIRIFGPNCQGIINTDPDIRAYCNFTFTYPEPGNISIVAQSGGVGAVILQAFYDMGEGIRFYASNGNASDISIPEIIQFYGNDDKTKAIVVFVESLSNPGEFMRIVNEVTAIKPVLAIFAGRTDKGAEASRSHVGGLAGSISMEHIFKKSGILSFSNQEDMCHAAVALSAQPIPKGNRVGVITNTGGPSVIAIDELVSCGLVLPPLSDEAIESLKNSMLESASINNPLDVLATAGASHFKSALNIMMKEDQIDSIYINFVTPLFVDCESVAREIAFASKNNSKPIVCNYMTDKQKWTATSKILKENKIPCFDFAETAARALSSLVRYNHIRTRKTGQVKQFTDVDKESVKNILTRATENHQDVLTAGQVYSILGAYHVPVADWRIADNLDEALKASEEIGFPIVIKVDSVRLIHKKEAGGVALNLKNSGEVKLAVEKMQKNLNVNDLKFFVQKYIPMGKELIIGAKKENGIGHLIMFGLGGIFVEILNDVVFNISPVTDAEAREMPDLIKAAPLINGFRGETGIDKEKIVEIIQRISMLVSDFPAIKELDLNPILGFEDNVCTVDARIIL